MYERNPIIRSPQRPSAQQNHPGCQKRQSGFLENTANIGQANGFGTAGNAFEAGFSSYVVFVMAARAGVLNEMPRDAMADSRAMAERPQSS